MRTFLCGFALGVWCLQQCAELPGASQWWALGLAAPSVAAGAWLLLRQPRRPGRPSGAGVGGTLLLGVLAALLGFGWAAARAELRLARALPLPWEGRDLMLTGVVVDLPRPAEHGTRFLFDVQSNAAALTNFPGRVQLTWFATRAAAPPKLQPGQRWTFTVRLKRPHGNANYLGFDTEAALLERNVRATGYVRALPAARLHGATARSPRVLIDRWRAALRARIDSVLPAAPHAGVVVALAIGAQSGIAQTDWEVFRRTGTNHLVAISGLHVGLVAGLGGALCSWLWRHAPGAGRRWPLLMPAQQVAFLAGGLAGAVYAALAGFGVPAQRALWMLLVAALAYSGRRAVSGSVVLAWALALVLLVDPWAVTSAGFWLSFGAVCLIVAAVTGATGASRGSTAEPVGARSNGAQPGVPPTFAQKLAGRAAHSGRRWRQALAGAARVQWAITVGLVPMTLLWFSQVPLAGPAANALAIPWVSFLVTPAVLAGVVLPAPLDALAFQFAHTLLGILIHVLTWLGSPDWALWRAAAPSRGALLLALSGLAWWLAPRGWPLRWAAPLTWLPLLWPAPDAPRPGEFRMTVLDVGQGAATLIETADHRLLFDTGPGIEAGDAGKRIVLPYLQAHGIAALDAVIVSHADSDHAGGARSVLDGVRVARLLASLPAAHPLWRAARRRGAAAVPCRAGQAWQWDGVGFELFWPQAAAGRGNHASCVLRVAGTAHAAVLAGDIDARAERALTRRHGARLHASILLAPHHGSNTSSTEEFLDTVAPREVVFQVGYRNRFKHPHARVVGRYEAHGVDWSRSDRDGAVRFVTDGAALHVERYRSARRRYWMGR